MSSIIKGAMRIGGKEVSTDEVVNVHYPYTNEIMGTVPNGRAEHAKNAFKIAANFKPKLTRYERQKILFRTAELIMRWTEMAAFTPVMRTHEGNRPRDRERFRLYLRESPG